MVSRHRVFSTIQTKNPTRHDTGICIIRSLVHVAWNSLRPSKFTWGHGHTNLCEHETYRFSLSSDDEKPNHTKEEGAGYFLEKVGGEEVGKPPAVSTWAERSSVRVWRKKKEKKRWWYVEYSKPREFPGVFTINTSTLCTAHIHCLSTAVFCICRYVQERLSLCRSVCGFPSANTPATVVLHPKQPGKGTYANVQTCYFVIVSCSVRQGKDGWLWMEAAAVSSPPWFRASEQEWRPSWATGPVTAAQAKINSRPEKSIQRGCQWTVKLPSVMDSLDVHSLFAARLWSGE